MLRVIMNLAEFCPEVAQEGSSNEEDEYRPSKIPHMILETNEADVVIGEFGASVVLVSKR